jgi:hypothetical protein
LELFGLLEIIWLEIEYSLQNEAELNYFVMPFSVFTYEFDS